MIFYRSKEESVRLYGYHLDWKMVDLTRKLRDKLPSSFKEEEAVLSYKGAECFVKFAGYAYPVKTRTKLIKVLSVLGIPLYFFKLKAYDIPSRMYSTISEDILKKIKNSYTLPGTSVTVEDGVRMSVRGFYLDNSGIVFLKPRIETDYYLLSRYLRHYSLGPANVELLHDRGTLGRNQELIDEAVEKFIYAARKHVFAIIKRLDTTPELGYVRVNYADGKSHVYPVSEKSYTNDGQCLRGYDPASGERFTVMITENVKSITYSDSYSPMAVNWRRLTMTKED